MHVTSASPQPYIRQKNPLNWLLKKMDKYDDNDCAFDILTSINILIFLKKINTSHFAHW